MLLALFALGCTPEDIGPSDLVRRATEAESDDDSPVDTGDTAEEDWWDEPSGDADGDGYTVDEGDCDDGDRDVHPGAADVCDSFDNDCDGELDEDAAVDEYEPNDDTPVDLGDLGTEGEVLVYGYLFDEYDEDRFVVHVTDGLWDWFTLETWLYQVPEDTDLSVELVWLEDDDGDYRGTIDLADDGGAGDEELIDYNGSSGWDDSGYYEVIVRSEGGASCHHPYTLQILAGTW